MAHDRQIILFHYPFSPYARRIIWYLNLRNIPYLQCIQPLMLPRPDTRAIGTVYRRIPILAIGRDIYNDTRLILAKLDVFFPPCAAHPSLAPPPAAQPLVKLLEHWAVDSGLFNRAAQLIPADLPFSMDTKLQEDRREFSGGRWVSMERIRPEALVDVRGAFEFLEGRLLGDGRAWLVEGKGPSMAEIEGIWPFHWLTTLPGALPAGYICPQTFPKTFAWIKRFDVAFKVAAKKAGKPKSLKGDEALKQINNSEFAEEEGVVDTQDPTELKKRQEIEVWPIDTGFSHKDRGPLIALSSSEIVIESRTKDGVVVRVHTPRHGFRLRGVNSASAKI
ncbi:hypothetical protein BJ878DRAFT_424010 [Calycina marina]|uniref:GST N-terminal domain-containing protein n=1 Tax=Calycina marina TaxID=1763456 RepID=A0A9P7Z0X8_9HELO|nr:hypothetical protein BJ878DRAFT_424010 [Calycina marina]